MPRGTTHEVTGWLNEQRPGFYSIRVDGGGEWRVDPGLGWNVPRAIRRLVGRRVRLVGVRDGFDLLAATQVQAVD